MSEEAKQIDMPITTPVISSDLEPEPTMIPSTVLIRGTFVPDVDEPPTRMEENPDSTYSDGGTGFIQQAATANAKSTTTTRTTTLQGLNIGNSRKQLISLCDLNVADVENWKSMSMSVKDLKHLDIDDFMKNPVLTQSYKVTKFQWLQTQLEASTLSATQSLTARNSQVDTLTITNQNFLKVSEDREKTIVTGDSKLPSVNFEEMLGAIELPDVNSFQKCPTQFSLIERPDFDSTAPTSDLIAIENIPEKCAVTNSNPASILNHLSSDLSEEMSDNGCVSLSADDVFKTDCAAVETPVPNDAVSPGHYLIINADNRSEASERKDQQESIKPKTGDATKRDSKHPVKHNEEATNTSVSHAITQPAPGSEHNQCDHMVLNVSSAAKATDKNDSTRKEVAHTNKKEEAIVKSVFISVSQEEIKGRKAFTKEDAQEPMKGVMQIVTNLETKEIDRLEPVSELREYPPLNLGIGSRVSRELDVLVSFRNDDAKTLENFNGNNVAEILRKRDGRPSEIKAIIPLERFEMKCSVERRDGIKKNVNFYSSESVNESGQSQTHSLDLNGLRNDCSKQDGVDTSHIDDDSLKETRARNKTCDIYKEVTMSTTGLLENAEYKNTSLLCTNQSNGTEMDGMNTIITYSEGRRNIHENKTKYYPNERETPQETADLSQQETYVFEQHNLETISLPEILRSYVSYQTENEFPCIYIHDDTKVNETNKESVPAVDGSQNGDTLVGRSVPGQDAAKKEPSAEDGGNKHENGFYSINSREISKEEGKDHDSGPIVVFENNVENIYRPTVEDDGRAVVAVTQGQTEVASTKCARKTADKSTDVDFINVSKPFHLTTSSTSSILRVSNNDLQAGGIRIMYGVKEDHPKAGPSMMSRDKLKLLTSNFAPLDYRRAETAMDTFMVTSSAIDEVRVPECSETDQSSFDFRRMNTSSINITKNVTSNNSVLPDLKSSNMEDRQAGSVGCVIKELSSVGKKKECISPPKTVDVTQNDLANAPSTEMQNKDDICSRTSRRDVNGIFLTQLIADTSEMGNPLIRKDIKDEIYGTTKGDPAVQHTDDGVGGSGGGNGDATGALKEAAPTCQAREKTEKKCEETERAKRELKSYSIETQPESENNASTNVQVGIAVTMIGITKAPTYEGEIKICEKDQTQNDDQSLTTSVTRKVNKCSCQNRDAIQTQKNNETARAVRDMFIVGGEYKERRSAFSGHREALKMPAHLPTCPLKRYQETFLTRCFTSPIMPSSVSHSFKSTPNWSSKKLSAKALSSLSSSGLHSDCNSPTCAAMHVLSNEQRERCPFVSNEKIVTNENTDVANRSESLLSRVDQNQNVRHAVLLSGDQSNIPLGDLAVFPNLSTKKHNKADPMQPRPNPNVRKKNKSFQHEKDHSCGDGSADVLFRVSRRKKNNGQLNELMRYHLNRKKRWNPYEQWASMPPPPSPASPAVHSPLKDFVQHDHNILTEDMPSTPKTFRKGHTNCKNLRELKELEKSLKIETSRINKPAQVKFQPYIFTSLEPYYDTSLVRYMMEHPHGPYPGYRSRQTALGLCDPTEDLKLDTYILPKVSVKTLKKIQDSYKKIQKCERRSQPKSSNTKQSFPLVNKQGQNMTKRQMTFSEGPTFRKELQQKCTSNAHKKILQDYQRTKEDIYRVERNPAR